MPDPTTIVIGTATKVGLDLGLEALRRLLREWLMGNPGASRPPGSDVDSVLRLVTLLVEGERAQGQRQRSNEGEFRKLTKRLDRLETENKELRARINEASRVATTRHTKTVADLIRPGAMLTLKLSSAERAFLTSADKEGWVPPSHQPEQVAVAKSLVEKRCVRVSQRGGWRLNALGAMAIQRWGLT